MPYKSLNISPKTFEKFQEVKGELIQKAGLNLNADFILNCLILKWNGDSAEIETEIKKQKLLTTAEKVEKL